MRGFCETTNRTILVLVHAVLSTWASAYVLP
jgi:hypothetical protein